jgi:hypothetical protein
MMAKSSMFDQIRALTQDAKAEYRDKRKALLQQLADLDHEYAFLGVGNGATNGGRAPKASSGRKYGAVREAVLSAITAKGVKPIGIINKTGLSSQQVHNSLTGLKKAKLVRVKGGIYTPT